MLIPSGDISPSLLGLFRRKHPAAVEALTAVLCWVGQHGGYEELDYVRKAGQGYNPRPCRVVEILLKETKGLSPEELMAAACACIADRSYLLIPLKIAPLSSPLTEDIAATAIQVFDTLTLLYTDAESSPEAEENENAQISETVSLLASAHYLDRLRHFHLASQITPFNPDVVTQRFLHLSGIRQSRLGALVNHCHSRQKRHFAT